MASVPHEMPRQSVTLAQKAEGAYSWVAHGVSNIWKGSRAQLIFLVAALGIGGVVAVDMHYRPHDQKNEPERQILKGKSVQERMRDIGKRQYADCLNRGGDPETLLPLAVQADMDGDVVDSLYAAACADGEKRLQNYQKIGALTDVTPDAYLGASVLRWKALWAERRGRPEEAVALYRRATADDPGQVSLAGLARCLHAMPDDGNPSRKKELRDALSRLQIADIQRSAAEITAGRRNLFTQSMEGIMPDDRATEDRWFGLQQAELSQKEAAVLTEILEANTPSPR